MIALFGVLGGILAPGAAFAADGQIKLVLRPLDQKGPYFDLTMQAGETRSLGVEIGNAGSDALAVRTYAADVYTIVNGGFGARLGDDAQTGVTHWLVYPTDVLQLASHKAIDRSFSIAVPAATGPGEYITSIILENDKEVAGTGTVVLNQFVRQAIAVVITVPGQRAPGLAIGAASHSVIAQKSVVGVAVENPGNTRLKPVATLTLMDAAGTQVSHAVVPMDTFYAATTSAIEVPLAALLQPGTYSVHLALEDVSQNVRVEATRTFVVDAPIQPISNGGAAPALIGVSQKPVGAQDSVEWWPVAIGGMGLAIAGLAVFAFMWRRRRRSPRKALTRLSP